MENKEKLPSELVEEILSRVPPKPLVRFRTVCKRWNTLFDDITFINNHKMTFQFILVTKSKAYSISLNPEIEVRELTLDIPGLKDQKPNNLVECNGFLLCGKNEGAVVCNPWSGQTRCIKGEFNQPGGIGYDDNRIGKNYKTLAFHRNGITSTTAWRIHDLATDTWKDVLLATDTWKDVLEYETRPKTLCVLHSIRGVSLNGTLYWVAYYQSHPSLFLVLSYNFRTERYFRFCGLPCEKNDRSDALGLRVFRGDRFSLLKQCHVTKKIQIWVAKDKIDNGYSSDVEWVSFMEVSIPNFPKFHQPSYFIEDKRDGKRLVVCSCDVDGRAWIYVVGESKLISKTLLDSVVDPWPLHCTCFASLVMVPGCQREDKEEEKAELRVNISFGMLFVWLLGKLKFFFSKINYF